MNQFGKAFDNFVAEHQAAGIDEVACVRLDEMCGLYERDKVTAFACLYQHFPDNKAALDHLRQLLLAKKFDKADVTEILMDLKVLYQVQGDGDRLLKQLGQPLGSPEMQEVFEGFGLQTSRRSHEYYSPFHDLYLSFNKKRITKAQKAKTGVFSPDDSLLQQLIFSRVTAADIPSFSALPFGLQWWHLPTDAAQIMQAIEEQPDKRVQLTHHDDVSQEWGVRNAQCHYSVRIQFDDDEGFVWFVQCEMHATDLG